MKIEAYTSECVPAGCHSLSLLFEFFRKKYEVTTFSTEADALHRHHWVKAEPGCRYGNDWEG